MSSNPQGNSSTTQENEHLFTDDGLTRKLGLSTAIAICIGTTVGSGIFSSIGEIANASGSALFIALSFFLGGLYQIPASLFYAELYSAYPVNGGIYKNFEMAGWRPIAFISGATQFVGSDPPGLSVMALSIASYIGYFTHHSELTGKFIAVAFILVFMFIHIRSVEGGGKILDIITTFKIIPFVVLAGVAIFYARGELLTAPPAPGAPAGFTALLAGISATTWSYDGTSQVVLFAGEIKNPKKNMPRALILSVLLITAFYTIFSTAMAGLLPINQLAASSAPVADAVSTIPSIGKAAGSLAAALAVVVVTGTLCASVFSQPRVQYQMARDGLFFPKFGEVHPKYQTPAFSIAVQCALAIFFIFASSISEILGYFTLVVSLRSIFGYLVIFEFRKRPDYNPTFKLPFWRFTSILLALIAFVMFLSTLSWAPPISWLYLVIAIVLGLIGYNYFEKRYGQRAKNDQKNQRME